MDKIGRIWLDPGEKLEAFRDRNLLRLVTTKQKAEIVLKDLHAILARIESKAIPINIISSEPIDDALLEEVGRITNTDVRKSHTGRRVSLPWNTTSTSFHLYMPWICYTNVYSLYSFMSCGSKRGKMAEFSRISATSSTACFGLPLRPKEH